MKLTNLLPHAETLHLDEGTIIVREGEVPDAMYLITSGDVQVYKTLANGSEIVLAKLSAGDHFGEQGLLRGNSGRRSASVRASSAVTLGRVEKSKFLGVVAGDDPLARQLAAMGAQQLKENLARESSLLRAVLSATDPHRPLGEKQFSDGEVIFREGDPSEELYILLSGSVSVYRHENGEPQLLRLITAGQCFGELGVLDDRPRAGTVIASGAVQTLVIDRARFRELCERVPGFKEQLTSVTRAYQLPQRGFLTQHAGQLMGQSSITTIYCLETGRMIAASQVVGGEIFSLEALDDFSGSISETLVYEDSGLRRELRLSPDRVVLGITAHGAWPELRELLPLTLDGSPLTPSNLEWFQKTGELGLAAVGDAGMLCTCVGVDARTIQNVIASGATTFAAVQDRTGCATVCGSCGPSVLELLGQEEWVPVVIGRSKDLAQDIRSFVLEPKSGALLPSKAGQHIVVQGRIDGVWVSRSYTLTSTPSSSGFCEIGVKRESQGTFSRWLFERASSGDELIRISSPRGEVFWTPGDRPAVCFVAGIGVTPAVAIARTIVEHDHAAPVHVHYSSRGPGHFAYLEELERLAKLSDRVRLTVRQTSTQGRLEREDVAALVKRYPNAEHFLCGPQGYLDHVAALLAAEGVSKDRIRIEVFTHAGGPPKKKVVAKDPEARLMIDPQIPPRSLISKALEQIGRALSDAANSRLNPARPLERFFADKAQIDPNVPYEYFGAVGTLAKGTFEHPVDCFKRIAHLEKNKQLAREAKARGAPLPPSTPDGDSFAYVLPAAPLPKFEGSAAIDTGWTRMAPGAVLPLYVVKGKAAVAGVVHSKNFDRGPMPYHFVQQLVGVEGLKIDDERKAAGLFAGPTNHNLTWDEDRRLAEEMFAFRELDLLGAGMARALSDDIGPEIDAHADSEPDRVVDATALMSRIAYRMILRASLGNVDFAQFDRLGTELAVPVRGCLHTIQQAALGRPGGAKALTAASEEARRIVADIIAKIRELHAKGDIDGGPHCSGLVRLSTGDMPDNRLYTFVLPIIFGGHETTGYTMAWALYHMARDPALMKRVVGEVDTFQRENGNRAVTYRDYAQRPLTQALLYETLRRHPPVPALTRTAIEAGTIEPDPETGIGGFTYPASSLFFCSTVGTQMDPELYPDPDSFRLERFMEGVEPDMPIAKQGAKVLENYQALSASYAMYPFGAGPGRCLGQAFNMLEFFLVLDHMMSRYRFELPDPSLVIRDNTDAALTGPEPGLLGIRIRRR
jgi:ferredoxin-NADP reductase/cytochrome P450/CRP-like cAMP-binding protein